LDEELPCFQEPLLGMIAAAEENAVFVLLPRLVMAPTQTAMMKASMTAYSTEVGPSSLARNAQTE
jgi:hypothetical protein